MRAQKTVFVLCFLIIFILTALAGAQTGSPQETLKQHITDLQKNPDEFALREKIIKLVQGMKPQPVIPQDAKRPFMKGVTFMKEATSASDYDLAIKAFNEALLLAPWWPETYYNLVLAQEAAGKFDDGIRSIKLYLMTKPKDVEEAENKMYIMEAKKEKAAKDAGKASQGKATKSEEFVQNLAGIWFDKPGDPTHFYYQMNVTGKNEFSLRRTEYGSPGQKMISDVPETFTGTVEGTAIKGKHFWSASYIKECGTMNLSGTFEGTISTDGKKIWMTVITGRVGRDCTKESDRFTKEFIKE